MALHVYDQFRTAVLRLLKVPPEPHAPAGSPGSLQVFRAGLNYYRFRRGLWLLQKGVAFTFLILGFLFVHAVLANDLRIFKPFPFYRWLDAHRGQIFRWHPIQWFILVEMAAFTLAVINLVTSYVVLRLEYEMHWYMVTDRSLRIREGVTRVREMTLSFANIQQIVVRQGPLQRLLGLADVVVTTAGGGDGHSEYGRHQRQGGEPCHIGVLRSVDNAEVVRDLMLERLRHLKSAGLGDPEDHVDSHAGPGTPVFAATPIPVLGDSCNSSRQEGVTADSCNSSLQEAVREALSEARALRLAMTKRG